MDKQELKYLLLIIVIFIAACIETDIYLPAFADMMQFFETSEEAIQKILTWNFFGICISGPVYGPISDAIGRRKPLLVALGLFLFGSILTLFAVSFETMLWGRLLQGIGSGGIFTLGTAIIFDAFQKEKAIRALNYVNTIIPFIMAGAPLLGGFLNAFYGFRANFFVITLFVLASFLISLFSFDETLPEEKRIVFVPKRVLQDFARAIFCLPFWLITLALCLAFAAYINFLSGSAVLFVVDFGISKTLFPLYQAAQLIGWLAGSLTTASVLKRFDYTMTKKIGCGCMLLAACVVTISTLVDSKQPLVPTLAMMLYCFGVNWANALYFPEAMDILSDIKGITASLITSARLLITALVVGMTAVFYDGTMYPLAIASTVCIVISLVSLFFYERFYGQKQLAPQAIDAPVMH